MKIKLEAMKDILSDGSVDDIAHCYDTNKPIPWTSYCGQKQVSTIRLSGKKQKCVVCADIVGER